LKADLENIISLHKTDSVIESFKRICTEIPVVIAKLKNEISSVRRKIDDYKVEIKENEKKIRKNEQDIETHRQQQGKYRAQLFKLKSNKEYTALNAEIIVLDEAISKLETEILELLEKSDRSRESLKLLELSIKDEELRINAKIREKEAELDQEKEKLEHEELVRSALIESLHSETVEKYLKIVKKRGSAVAEIISGNCGGCNVKVRPQMASLVRSNDQLIQCEKCGRFLYWGYESE
jgi:uncharacterized protein